MAELKAPVAGIHHQASFILEQKHTVPELDINWQEFRDMPPVLATAVMTSFIEQTCVELLRPYMNAGEHTVGTAVDLTHTAASLPGETGTATTELTSVDGRNLKFRVECRDTSGIIGSGTHRRVIINKERFMDRLTAKARKAG